MAHRPTRAQLRRQFEALVGQWEPQLRDAFFDAVVDLTSHAEIGRIAELLERGDIEAAIRAVHLDPAAFRALESAVVAAYGAGGIAAVQGMPVIRDPSGGQVVIRFDVRAPRAEVYLSHHSAQLVTRIVDDQRAAIRTALTAGLEAGRNPRSTALDVVGRINRATGRREGGVIGLTARQSDFVASARSELLSGDPEQLRHYLSRSVRDKRFDRTVLAAIRDGNPVDTKAVERMAGRYADNLLRVRGETLARTETMTALAESKEEAFRQAIDTGAVQEQHVMKVWRATRDRRTRDSHAAINGEAVRMDQPFSNGLMYPHQEGAPAEEIINCRCDSDYRIDFLAGIE